MCQKAQQPVISFTESFENTFTSAAVRNAQREIVFICMVMWPKLKGACAVTWRDGISETQILWSISDAMFEAV